MGAAERQRKIERLARAGEIIRLLPRCLYQHRARVIRDRVAQRNPRGIVVGPQDRRYTLGDATSVSVSTGGAQLVPTCGVRAWQISDRSIRH